MSPMKKGNDLMNRKNVWFDVYRDNKSATNLSMLGGGAKLFSLLLMVAAVPVTLALLVMSFQMASMGGFGRSWFFIFDELDDMIFMAFMLWSAIVVLRYASRVCFAKAEMMAEKTQEPFQEASVEGYSPIKRLCLDGHRMRAPLFEKVERGAVCLKRKNKK